jgi:hypothetical protein
MVTPFFVIIFVNLLVPLYMKCHFVTSEITTDHYSDVGLLLSSCTAMVSAEIPAALEVSVREKQKICSGE